MIYIWKRLYCEYFWLSNSSAAIPRDTIASLAILTRQNIIVEDHEFVLVHQLMILKCCRLVDPGVPTLQDQSCPSASCSVRRNWWLILAAKSKKHSVPSQTCTGPKCQCKTLSYSCFRSLMLRFANGGFIRLGSKIERVENRVIIGRV